ncbi:MAG: ATP-binding protein [Promethearchaeota archaeon]
MFKQANRRRFSKFRLKYKFGSYLIIFLCGISFSYLIGIQQIKETNAQSASFIVGIYDDPPLVIKDSNDSYSGVFIEILDYIAEKHNWQIIYRFGTWIQCLNWLNSSQIDFLMPIAYSEERDSYYDFHNNSFIINYGELIENKDLDINSFFDLEGLKIGVLKKDIYYDSEGGIKDILQSFEITSTFIIFENYLDIIKAVENETVDVGAVPRSLASYFISEYHYKVTNLIFQPIDLLMAALEGNPLINTVFPIIDEELQNMKSNHDSFYYKILAKYLSEYAIYKIPEWVNYLIISVVLIIVAFLTSSIYFKIKYNRQESKKQILIQELENQRRFESLSILAGGIAHDFNNLLMSVLGNISLLKLEKEITNEMLELINEAERAVLEAKSLTNQLQTFALTGDLEKKPLDLTEILKSTPKFLLRGSNIKLNLEIPEDLWNIEVDPQQVNQVFINLIVNAREAMPNGGELTIRAQNIEKLPQHIYKLKAIGKKDEILNRKYVLIQISDTGVGIKKEHLNKIFDPFFTTKKSGRGLGLSIVKSIIRKNNGLINVESEEAKGTTFSIYFPKSNLIITKTFESEIDIEDIKKKLSNLKILIVEDQESLRRLYENFCNEIISKNGICNTTKSYLDAKNEIKKAISKNIIYNIIILDLTVPGENDAVHKLKEFKKISPQSKFIIATGYSMKELIKDYKKYGFDACLIKPITFSEFIRVLNEIYNPK